MVCAAISLTGSTTFAQGGDPLPLDGRLLMPGYAYAVDPAVTRLGPSWTVVIVPTALPGRLLAQAHLQPLVDELWSRSATFRAQCRRLAAARAVVVLQGATGRETPWDAESQIGVQANGRVLARTRVRAGRESVAVIAHELEHVIEQLDGVRLALDAARPGSGTTLAGGAFETRRATEAGRRAAREVRAAQ
jgi:hypothetical protein